MNKQLLARTKKLEDKLKPKKNENLPVFMLPEWEKLDEVERAEIRAKHSQVLLVRFVHAKDGKPVSSDMQESCSESEKASK